jgi:hypothetical protein
MAVADGAPHPHVKTPELCRLESWALALAVGASAGSQRTCVVLGTLIARQLRNVPLRLAAK